MTTEKLKPCPFCGAIPESFPSGDGTGLMIECVTPNCVRPHTSWYPPATAIQVWNTRAMLRQEGSVEELQEVLARAIEDAIPSRLHDLWANENYQQVARALMAAGWRRSGT
jgi:hypothetical protein